jgi:hypothetical protein
MHAVNPTAHKTKDAGYLLSQHLLIYYIFANYNLLQTN